MKIYENKMMPKRGGWWPECLGTVMLFVFGTFLGYGFAEILHHI